MKRTFRYLPLLLASASCVPFAAAQSTFDINMGFGAIQNSAAKQGLDNTTLNNCTLGSSVTCIPTPSLNKFVLGFGGNLMLWNHFGVGAEVSFQPSKQDYLNLPVVPGQGVTSDIIQARNTFFDFNGIYQPIKAKKVALDLIGGFGGVNVKFYENQSANTSLLGNQSYNQFAGSSNHFQLHGGVGVKLNLTDHIFIRPEFDLHYVPNYSQYGRNVVTQEMVWIGYSFGGN